jgi:hypothetical protein
MEEGKALKGFTAVMATANRGELTTMTLADACHNFMCPTACLNN